MNLMNKYETKLKNSKLKDCSERQWLIFTNARIPLIWVVTVKEGLPHLKQFGCLKG